MDIVLNTDIKTTPDRLYEAITTQKGLAGWYTPQTKAAPKVGALNEFHFGSRASLTFLVEKLEPTRHIAWSGVQVPPDWEGTRLTFDITPKGDSLDLRFSQTGLPSPYPDFGCFSYLWGQYMRSLKLLLETGNGEPYGSPGSKAAGTTPP